MAKKRVFLDECCSELADVFGAKAHTCSAKELSVNGIEDTRVIDAAVDRKCLIVTVNKDFVDYYREHPRRKRGEYFYGLIFLHNSDAMPRRKQLQQALKGLAWSDTRDHDDIVFVNARGKTRCERLCHPECAAKFPAEQTVWG